MDASDVLRLEVRNFQGPERWDWALTTAVGELLAYHEVRLDPESLEYKAMTRLQFYVRWRAEPERPLESEKEFLGQVGQWMGERVFGDVGRKLVEWRPVTALVVVPSGARILRHWPFELTWVDGQPLALQEVSLLFDVSDVPAQGASRAKVPIGNRLRMLAVFSLPAEEPLLLLSQQRYELVRSIGRVAASTGRSVSLVTVQYGVTRKRLGEILKQGEGWDVIHFSGHGLASRLLLEGADGHADPMPTDELLQTLHLARSRLKLLVLSSCESGAAAGNEAIRVGASPADGEASEDFDDRRPLPAVAVEAARQLDCAVLGMRYRVSDDFAIGLAHHLYDNLFDKQNFLPRALQLALPEALEHWPEPGNPPLSVATPALFGQRGADLSLVPPAAESSFALGGLKMSYFDREPELFVGRVEPMAAASRVLAPDDRFSGVLFHAPGPTGKTACAVELAYLYKDQFRRLVRHRAPTHHKEIAGSLVGLAESLETQLEQFGPAMKQAVRSRTELERFLPRLKELMEQHAILVFIDGIEELLTTDGNWRDDMWRLVIDALLDDNRASRLVLTSRRQPAKLHDRLRVIPVPPLSPEEALLLARQLPHLGDVLRGRTELPMERAATLLADTLVAAAGMPGLIHEADKQLTSPSVLDELPTRIAELARAAGTYDGTTDRREEYLRLVQEWTRGIQRSASPEGASTPRSPEPPPEEPPVTRPPVTQPPGSSSPAADLDGLSDQQIQLLRTSATALKELLGTLAELDGTPPVSVNLVEVSSRWQASLNRVGERLVALQRQVTVRTWPHSSWAVKFGSVRDQVQQDINAVQEQPDRPAVFRWGRTNERERRLRASAARLLQLLESRYSSLDAHGRDVPTPAAKRLSTPHEQIDDILAALAQSPSFETVTAALETVNDLNGLAGGIATVQGGTDDVGSETLSMRVRFLWGMGSSESEPSLLIQAVSPINERYYFNHPELQREPILDNDDRLYAYTFWEPNQSPEEIRSSLIRGLMRKSAFQGSATLDWDQTLTELGHTLGVVLAARQGEARWPIAPLFELVGDDWAITTAGLEYRTERWPVLFPEQFSGPASGEQAGGGFREGRRHPDVPAGIPPPDERLWTRASAYFPPRNISTTPAGWSPVRRTP